MPKREAVWAAEGLLTVDAAFSNMFVAGGRLSKGLDTLGGGSDGAIKEAKRFEAGALGVSGREEPGVKEKRFDAAVDGFF